MCIYMHKILIHDCAINFTRLISSETHNKFETCNALAYFEFAFWPQVNRQGEIVLQARDERSSSLHKKQNN